MGTRATFWGETCKRYIQTGKVLLLFFYILSLLCVVIFALRYRVTRAPDKYCGGHWCRGSHTKIFLDSGGGMSYIMGEEREGYHDRLVSTGKKNGCEATVLV